LSDPATHLDQRAERALLAGLFGQPIRIADAATLVRPADFASDTRGAVFEALVALDGASATVDELTMLGWLKANGKPTAGLGEVLGDVAVADRASHGVLDYARMVADAALRRRLAVIGADLAKRAAGGEAAGRDLLSEAEGRLMEAVPEHGQGATLSMQEVAERTAARLTELVAGGGGITGLATGFHDLDHMMTGLHPGELVIVAARPGGGKSCFGMNAALHAAMRLQVPALFVSLEMAEEQLGFRALSAEAKVELSRLRSGRISVGDELQIKTWLPRLATAPLYIRYSPGAGPADLRAEARRLKRKEPRLGLLVVDYVQLMGSDGVGDSREEQVAYISRSLKRLAGDVGLPVLALAQLNRKVEERKGPPMLSDLRNSGAIEQDADTVVFLHPEQSQNKDDETKPEIPVEAIVAKQRNGPLGSAALLFQRSFTRFVNTTNQESADVATF
jgi:replicative DNA helicase